MTDELDNLVDRIDGGHRDLSMTSEQGLQLFIEKSKNLTEMYPGFIDGYAHMVGALVAQGKHLNAVRAGIFEIYDGFIMLAPKVEAGAVYQL